MPILSICMRSQDLDNDGDNAVKTFRLENTKKLTYLKLLHIYHNIDNRNITDSQGTSDNSIIFAKFGFLNSNNAVYYENLREESYDKDQTEISDGSAVSGKRYIIRSVGTSTFTSIGAGSNAVGVIFTATGSGDGTKSGKLFELQNKSAIREHQGLVCLGETIKDANTNNFRDCYKVLHDGGVSPLFLNQPFKVELFKLETIDAVQPEGSETQNIYDNTGSHLISPITKSQFQGGLDTGGQYISFVFEYKEDYRK